MQPESPWPPTKTANVSPDVTAIMAVVDPPRLRLVTQ
jgi:hypothetical protein